MKMQNDIVSENPQSTVVAQYERTPPSCRGLPKRSRVRAGNDSPATATGLRVCPYPPRGRADTEPSPPVGKTQRLPLFRQRVGAFLQAEIANEGKGIIDKTETIQRDNIKLSPLTMARRKTSTSSTSKTLTTTTPR